ncbi:MAG TPA: polysaccharide deacetylase family protein [Acidimicrobiales bacterium]|nr:polysaccharide deacetylase family protein [Acidimicrobiales bacterium]|tara:strand:+ start:528 stop:1436 length:909 start_codon:yes stop_codon:yes gene_type:complete
MPADRSQGMDHPHYQYSPIPSRQKLRWPNEEPLAVGALVLLEHYEWDPPPDAYSLRNASGGLIKLPAPDYVQLTHREYGHRVGIFRLLDTLERHGVPVTVAVDALTSINYPWLMKHIAERNCEVVGHGFSASRLITSKMDDNVETEVITESLDALEETTGIRPTGWFSPEGVESSRTPQLLAAAGIQYVFDWPNDEQPYAMTTPTGNLTSLPLFLEIDDEFALWHRRASLASWEDMIVSAARRLHSDGKDSARHLIFTLRPWLTGQPFRIRSLDRALAQVMSLDDVWPVHGSELNAAFNKLS